MHDPHMSGRSSGVNMTSQLKIPARNRRSRDLQKEINEMAAYRMNGKIKTSPHPNFYVRELSGSRSL